MATRLPSGSYRTQVFLGYSESGKRQYRSFVADTAKKADLLALQWQAENHSGVSGRETLGGCISSFLKAKSVVLSASTIRGYKSMAVKLKAEYPKLCAKRIDIITANDMQELVNSLYREATPKTVRNYYGFLRSVYAYKGIKIPFVLCLPG